jgi:ClpP class serine protease
MRNAIPNVLAIREGELDAIVRQVEVATANSTLREQLESQRKAEEVFSSRIKAMEESDSSSPVEDLLLPVVAGVASVTMIGAITNRPNCMQELYGGCSAIMAEQELLYCLKTDAIDSVVIEFDTPGGVVDALPVVGSAIKRLRDAGKDVVALVNTNCHSAGYYLACFCSRIILTGELSFLGSIGVLTAVADTSAIPEKDGIKVYKIATGPNKGIGMYFSPVTKENLEAIKAEVMYAGRHFADVVSRRMSKPITIGEGLADGRSWRGSEAIKLGLADAIMPRDVLFTSMAKSGKGGRIILPPEPAPPVIDGKKETTSMNPADAKAWWAQLGNKKPAPAASAVATESAKIIAAIKDGLLAEGLLNDGDAVTPEAVASFFAEVQALKPLAEDGKEARASVIRSTAAEMNRLAGPGTVTEAEIEVKIAANRTTSLADLKTEYKKLAKAAEEKFAPTGAQDNADNEAAQAKAKAEADKKESEDIDKRLNEAGL